MASHSGTGDEGGSISLGASLVLRSLPSLLMINRETLVPGAASRDKQSSLLACSNDSHLLVGLAPSEPPFLLTISSFSSHLLRPSISRPVYNVGPSPAPFISCFPSQHLSEVSRPGVFILSLSPPTGKAGVCLSSLSSPPPPPADTC